MLQTYSLIALLILAGCSSSPKDFSKEPVTNAVGQTVTFVKGSDLHGWVKEHQNNKIIAITGYSGQYGTQGYVIIYIAQIEK